MSNDTLPRREIYFASGDGKCHAWLYEADGETPQPCIVMAHGFGLSKDCGLEPFAEAFHRRGYAVLVFDYRHFGKSEMPPAHWLSLGRQIEDWRAALRYAASLDSVDATRLIVWGTSLAAGHAITAASKDINVAAAIAQNPMLDGLDSTIAAVKGWGVINSVRIGMRAVRAALQLKFRRGRYGALSMLPTTAAPKSLGLLTSGDALPGYQKVITPSHRLELVADIALYFWTYRPIRHLSSMRIPVLFIACTQDTITPAAQARRGAKTALRGELAEFDCQHFDIYVLPHRQLAIDAALAFLHAHVPLNR